MLIKRLKYGLYTPNYGSCFGNAGCLSELAEEAEKAGWDGYFIWDHIQVSRTTSSSMVDPWIALTAMASKTKKIRIGTTVTPIARRRPWKLARETVSLDHFSNGRLNLGVGLGYPPLEEFEIFGEDSDAKVRAMKLDEGLDIIQGLWSGKSFSYEGETYQVKEVRFLPKPLQSPRIPIWVGGFWPNKKPFIRSAKFDGIIPLHSGEGPITPKLYKDILEFINSYRKITTPFDVIKIGKLPKNRKIQSTKIVPYADAGVNWWLEYFGASAKKEAILEKIKQGPPDI